VRPPTRRGRDTHRGPTWRGRGTAVLAAVALVVVPTAAAGQVRSSTEVERDLQREQRRAAELGQDLGEVRGEISGAEAELAEIGVRLDDARGRLRAAEGQVALGEDALVEAEQVQVDAEHEHARAEERLAHTEALLAGEEEVLADQIVQSFKYGTVGATRGAMVLEVLRRAEDPNTFSVGMKQLQVVVDTQETTVQRVFTLRGERAVQTDEAAVARGRAVQAAHAAADALAHLELLRDQTADLTAQIQRDEQRQQVVLANLRSDAASMQQVLQRVAVRQGELEQELRQRRAEEEAARIAAEQEAQRRREAQARAAAEREARRQAEAEARAAREAAASGSRDEGSSSGGSTGAGGSGDTSGGSNGSGGSSGSGGAGGGPALGSGICPVVGAVAGRDFQNDWGWPRSGGRTHQGTDIFASEGTPVVAIQGGTVVRTSPVDRGLGGITVTYRTGDGSEWYNAHLHTIAEGIVPGATVAVGQQIGTVGRTGNARTTPPHLHLGRRIGGSWVNPYPTVAPLCR
jgi:murein DD-endopeptidase MepM/ murein hydrolase activator NlpD